MASALRGVLPKYAYRTSLGVVAIVCLNDWFIEVHNVTGPSMSPTLSPRYNEAGQRDTILVRKWTNPGSPKGLIFGNPMALSVGRGDVVTFWKPHDPESMSVKRIVAVEGDTVFRDMRRVGREREREEQGVRKECEKLGMAGQGPLVTVPSGSVWVEGDNWRESLDSNDFGPVARHLIAGKAVAVIWPPSRMGWITTASPAGSSRSKIAPGQVMVPSIEG